MRSAISGNNSSAETFVADLLYANGWHQVEGVTGDSVESTKEFAEKPSIPRRFSSILEMLKNAGSYAVYGAPNPMHYKDNKFCLEVSVAGLDEKTTNDER